jgi:hypothetical protein
MMLMYMESEEGEKGVANGTQTNQGKLRQASHSNFRQQRGARLIPPKQELQSADGDTTLNGNGNGLARECSSSQVRLGLDILRLSTTLLNFITETKCRISRQTKWKQQNHDKIRETEIMLNLAKLFRRMITSE